MQGRRGYKRAPPASWNSEYFDYCHVLQEQTQPMPVYILMSKLTEHGVSRVMDDPPCLRNISMEIENFGVKVLEQYATLGEYDFVHVIEAPDNESIARVSMELIARGNLKPLTLPTISINDFISRLSLDRAP